MASRGVTIEGVRDLVKGFKDFNDKIAKNQGTGSKLAANAYKNDVQAIAPLGHMPGESHGNYRRSIHVEGPFDGSDGPYCVTGTDAVQGKQLEFGGIIRAKNAEYLVFKTEDGVWHKVKMVNQPPHPHFRTALDQNREKYIQMMKEAMLR